MDRHPTGLAAEQLRCFIERIEELEIQKSLISDQIKTVFSHATISGLDAKTMKQIIRLRTMTLAEREEQEALLDIYKASLGMLGDTALGGAAIRRLTKQQRELFDQEPLREEKPEDPKSAGDDPAAPQADPKPEPVDPGPTIEEAREMGRKSALNGTAVTNNPFPARDPRRAAWDEEWCRATGSDGMDLPDAWKRTAKKKDKDDKGDA